MVLLHMLRSQRGLPKGLVRPIWHNGCSLCRTGRWCRDYGLFSLNGRAFWSLLSFPTTQGIVIVTIRGSKDNYS